MPICNIILYIYIVHSSAMQAAAKTVVINMNFVCHGQDCNSILLGPATSGANELIVFRSHSVCNFQFKISPTGKKLTCTCILCYAVRIRLLKLLATRKRMKDKKHDGSIKLIVFTIHGNPTDDRDYWCAIYCLCILLWSYVWATGSAKNAPIYILCPSMVSVTFFCSLHISNRD